MRVIQISTNMCQSWRPDCGVLLLFYSGDPKQPNFMDIATATDQTIPYGCNQRYIFKKGTEINKQIIHKTGLDGCDKNVLIMRHIFGLNDVVHIVTPTATAACNINGGAIYHMFRNMVPLQISEPFSMGSQKRKNCQKY